MERSCLELYEGTTFEITRGKGTSVSSHCVVLAELGYKSDYARFYPEKGERPVYSTYEAYMQHLRTNLEAGRPSRQIS